jgi:Retron-type reverse transcriptase
MRPLGIPTVKDRVMQAIVKLALEPEWECRFEANAYGFRPGRNRVHAMTAIHTTLSRRGSSTWVLDADISGCFDNIGHDALLDRLPVFTNVIRCCYKQGSWRSAGSRKPCRERRKAASSRRSWRTLRSMVCSGCSARMLRPFLKWTGPRLNRP